MAQAWQIDVLVLGMPGWIQKRRWETEQDKSELEDLYARAGLPDSVHRAALETLLATKPEVAELVRLVPRPQAGDLTKLVSVHLYPHACTYVRDAVEYLSCASSPPLSGGIANALLARLDTACHALLANSLRRSAELEFVGALRCTCKCKPLVRKPAFFFAHWEPEKPNAITPAGVECSSLGGCIGDLLAHYLSKLVQGCTGSICAWNGVLWPRETRLFRNHLIVKIKQP